MSLKKLVCEGHNLWCDWRHGTDEEVADGKWDCKMISLSNGIGVLIARGKAGLGGSRLQFQYSRSWGKRISSCLRPGFKWDAVSQGREGGKEGEGAHWRAHIGNAMREDSKRRQPWSLTRNQPERGLVAPELWENAVCSPQREKSHAVMNFCRSLYIQYKVLPVHFFWLSYY